MTPILVTAAIAVVAGAVVAVSARDVRLVLVGLAVCLLVAPLVADPLPDVSPLVARAAASLLALEILNLAIRDREHALRGSLLGWPAKACAAGAAAIAGYAVVNGITPDAQVLREIGSASVTPVPMARAAGFALLALCAAPVLAGRDPLRMSIGGLLLLTGGELVRTGVVGPATGLEQLAVGGVAIALAVAFGALVTGAASPALGGTDGIAAELWPDAVPSVSESGHAASSAVPRSARGAQGGARVHRPHPSRDAAQLTLLDEGLPDGPLPAGPLLAGPLSTGSLSTAARADEPGSVR